MKGLSRILLVLTLCLCVAQPAFSQSAPPLIDDPEADLLPDVLVVAKAPGPPWWRVSKGASVVWIMGLPASPTPKGMSWDRKTLDRRLTGAQALLMPPTISLSFPAIKEVGQERALPQMPAPLAERFARAQKRLGKPVRRYFASEPSAAFFRLYGDYLDSARLERGVVSRWASAMAKTRRVPVVRPATVRAETPRLAQTDPALPGAAACYNALVEATEAPVERYRAAASGWARGDLATAISAPRLPHGICDNRLFNEGGVRRAIEIETAAIEGALAKPGKTVAVAELRRLLAEEGILARLKRDGYSVTSPNEPESPTRGRPRQRTPASGPCPSARA